jgi:hypothetical protein
MDKNLYEECEKCKDLRDCPHPDFSFLNEPMIPDGCSRPIEIMNNTLKVQKVRHKLIREN